MNVKKSAFDALCPISAELLKQAAEDYVGEQFAPRPALPPAPVITVDALQGHPELLAIARVDLVLAQKLKWLIEACSEADWESALHALDHIGFSVRTLQLESRADEAGVVRR
jgi:hypothetical protein